MLLLSDFGLAGTRETAVHPHAGTPAYIAPELWRNAKDYAEETDGDGVV